MVFDSDILCMLWIIWQTFQGFFFSFLQRRTVQKSQCLHSFHCRHLSCPPLFQTIVTVCVDLLNNKIKLKILLQIIMITFRLTDNLALPVNQMCMSLDCGSWSTRRKPTESQGEHANSAQKGPGFESNRQPSCCEVAM